MIPERLPARIRRMSFRRRKIVGRWWVEAHLERAVADGLLDGGTLKSARMTRDGGVQIDYEYTPVRPAGHVVIHKHLAPSMGYEVDAKFFDAQLGMPWDTDDGWQS